MDDSGALFQIAPQKPFLVARRRLARHKKNIEIIGYFPAFLNDQNQLRPDLFVEMAPEFFQISCGVTEQM
ncbi:MAG: hypothetical protein B7Z37_27990 [Verrucomicrobia bacterium 12-59-8]|nr:MAG: hypothetical protein B7Z37_27990 [Verrucomicrobia bacterium 12-59-8]